MTPSGKERPSDHLLLSHTLHDGLCVRGPSPASCLLLQSTTGDGAEPQPQPLPSPPARFVNSHMSWGWQARTGHAGRARPCLASPAKGLQLAGAGWANLREVSFSEEETWTETTEPTALQRHSLSCCSSEPGNAQDGWQRRGRTLAQSLWGSRAAATRVLLLAPESWAGAFLLFQLPAGTSGFGVRAQEQPLHLRASAGVWTAWSRPASRLLLCENTLAPALSHGLTWRPMGQR